MSYLKGLYEEHAPALLVYLRRFGGCEAEDWLHDTFVQAARHGDRLAEAGSARAWLFGVARHVALTGLRRRQKSEALPQEVADVSATTDPRLEAMRHAIQTLSNTHREALELRLREGLSYEEIADVLNIPIGTVRSRLHNSVRQLREILKDE